MSNDIPKAVVAGHLCLDIIPGLSDLALESGTDFFVPGKVRLIGPATLSTGGPVSNTGLALVRLGIDTALMGKVGDDPLGSLDPLAPGTVGRQRGCDHCRRGDEFLHHRP